MISCKNRLQLPGPESMGENKKQNAQSNYQNQEERIFNRYTTQSCELKCPNGYLIANVCINPECKKKALHCNEGCSACSSVHEECSIIKFAAVNKRLELKLESHKHFIRSILKIEDRLIKSIQSQRKRLIEDYIFGDIDGQNLKIINTIYFKDDPECLNGRQAQQLNESLKKSSEQHVKFAQQLISSFSKQSQIIINQYQTQRQAALEWYKRQKGQFLFDIVSKIVDSSKCQDFVNFIKPCLPKGAAKLQLLFRASQHDFSAAKFHQHCDNIEHTLVLVRSNHGRTFGGYTPCRWNAVSNGNWAPDSSGASFLFSVDLRKKFKLNDNSKSIHCYSDWGPRFGGGHDLHLADGRGSNDSYCNFPYSYDGNGRAKNQKSYTALCGSPNGYNFVAEEYEVYKVVLKQ